MEVTITKDLAHQTPEELNNFLIAAEERAADQRKLLGLHEEHLRLINVDIKLARHALLLREMSQLRVELHELRMDLFDLRLTKQDLRI